MEEGDLYVLTFHKFNDDILNQPLQPNWNVHDEFTASNPITDIEAFPRCSTPIPEQQLSSSLPISSCLFAGQNFEGFKNGLKQLPRFAKVRGVKKVPRYLLTGNIVTEERRRKLKQPTFKQLMQLNCDQLGQYVQDNHRKCKIEYSFNDKHELSPQSLSMYSYLPGYDECEFNEKLNNHSPNSSLPPYSRVDFPSILQPPNLVNMINDEDTPPFNEFEYDVMEYAVWSEFDGADDSKLYNWSFDNNIEFVPDENSTSSKDNQGTELQSAHSDLNLAFKEDEFGAMEHADWTEPNETDYLKPHDNNIECIDNSSTGLPSSYSDVDLSYMSYRLLRISLQEDLMRKHNGNESDEEYEKYLHDYNTQ